LCCQRKERKPRFLRVDARGHLGKDTIDELYN
jgi:hypothetical protein